MDFATSLEGGHGVPILGAILARHIGHAKLSHFCPVHHLQKIHLAEYIGRSLNQYATVVTFFTVDVVSGHLMMSLTSVLMTKHTISKKGNGVWTLPADWPENFLRKFSIRKDTLGYEQRDKLSEEHAYPMNQSLGTTPDGPKYH